MDIDIFTLYINPNAFILIPALYSIGLILDQTPKLPKWTHAWIKLVVAVVSCLAYFGFDIRYFVQGVLVTGAEMVLKEMIHHSITNYNREKTGEIKNSIPQQTNEDRRNNEKVQKTVTENKNLVDK